MRMLRLTIRIFLLTLWCTAVMIAAGASCLLAGGKWKRVRLGSWWVAVWSKAVCRIIGLRVRTHGELPGGQGALVVGNHLGYLDILVHGQVFKLRFAPKAEIKRWPVFGWLTALSAPVWIDRKNPRMSAVYAREFRETIENGVFMLVYPEGTSTGGKDGLLKFKSTPFASALECKSRIIPTLLFYSDPEAAWYDDTPFGVHILRVLEKKEITIDLYCFAPVLPEAGEDRKALAERIHGMMEMEYWKIENSR